MKLAPLGFGETDRTPGHGALVTRGTGPLPNLPPMSDLAAADTGGMRGEFHADRH
jgi:hypothetical protein